jgi:hypothetical protein
MSLRVPTMAFAAPAALAGARLLASGVGAPGARSGAFHSLLHGSGSVGPSGAPHEAEEVTRSRRNAGADELEDLRRAARLAPPMGSPGLPMHTLSPQRLDSPQGPSGAAAALAPAVASPSPLAAASLEEILPRLVRRVAWSGDGRRGTVRLELGAGPFAGATLLVQADGGRVEVLLDAGLASGGPAGADATAVHAWRDRIAARLEAQGVDASVEVR